MLNYQRITNLVKIPFNCLIPKNAMKSVKAYIVAQLSPILPFVFLKSVCYGWPAKFGMFDSRTGGFKSFGTIFQEKVWWFRGKSCGNPSLSTRHKGFLWKFSWCQSDNRWFRWKTVCSTLIWRVLHDIQRFSIGSCRIHIPCSIRDLVALRVPVMICFCLNHRISYVEMSENLQKLAYFWAMEMMNMHKPHLFRW